MKQKDVALVDHNALRTNQAVIITILGIAFIVDLPLLVVLCGALMLLGGVLGKPAFLPIYRLLRATGLIDPDPQADHHEPHRFAQIFGAAVLLTASVTFRINAETLGWILTVLVILLAGLNLFLGFCLGCTVYYIFARLGIPGFDKTPLEGDRDI